MTPYAQSTTIYTFLTTSHRSLRIVFLTGVVCLIGALLLLIMYKSFRPMKDRAAENAAYSLLSFKDGEEASEDEADAETQDKVR